jgi:hypothetical protein
MTAKCEMTHLPHLKSETTLKGNCPFSSHSEISNYSNYDTNWMQLERNRAKGI